MTDAAPAILAPIAAQAATLSEWRQYLHRHPELALEEVGTAAFVAEKLRDFGLAPETGIGGTGVVVVIEGAAPGASIALRADMDALPMEEDNDLPFRSQTAGAAHCCGHDGHTAALLGTAQYLAANPPAAGRVVLIFQPAEETGEGAKAMIADGLLDRFSFDEVYAFHNMPLLAPGEAGARAGGVLNGYAIWRIDVSGVGGHGAAFFKATDPLQAAARLAVEISSLVGRYVSPADSALVNVGALQAGSSHNIIADSAVLKGTLRALDPTVLEALLARLRQTCEGMAAMTGCEIALTIEAEVPPCVNHPDAAATAARACAKVLGEAGLVADHLPYPFTDDMALLLQAAPGAYLFLGQESAMCHNPHYRFDDSLLPVAASIFATIVKDRLG
ncbi:amidohydrolase [Aurantiacibacter flavus]|uniref:Amidohydrolase n=1 Tax=Aurantiacibacter flavus TaxID=3145232 RepID=A0ABV0CY90_9SPHN